MKKSDLEEEGIERRRRKRANSLAGLESSKGQPNFIVIVNIYSNHVMQHCTSHKVWRKSDKYLYQNKTKIKKKKSIEYM